METEKIVNVQKLISQLFNAKVVVEKIDESSGKNVIREMECVLPKGSRLKDSIQRYCPKCKTLKGDKKGVWGKRFCPDCESTLKFICSKCNSKQYTWYTALRRHWDICELTDSTPQKFNPSDFLVEEVNIDYAKEIIRYCSKCNEIDENCAKWLDEVCQNCDQYLDYQCNKCKSQFNKPYLIKYHMQRKCFPRNYKCNQCDYTSPLWDHMRRHVDYVHYGTKTQCPKCARVLKTEDSLRCHLRHCGVEPKFHCNCCAFKTKHKRSLQYHLKTVHGKS